MGGGQIIILYWVIGVGLASGMASTVVQIILERKPLRGISGDTVRG